MTEASATKAKLSEVIAQVSAATRFAEADKAKTSTAPTAAVAKKDKYAEIQSNPFFSIVFGKLSDKEKEQQIHDTAAYNPKLSKKENEARKDALLEIHGYLQSKATSLSEEQLAKMEVEGFGETRGVLEELGRRLIDFMGQMGEYNEIQNALERLRNDDKALDVLSEIFEENDKKDALKAEKAKLEADKAAELARLKQEADTVQAAQAAELKAKQDKQAQIEADKLRMREENAVHKETKGLFGQKKEAKQAEARNNELLKQADEELAKLSTDLGSLQERAAASSAEVTTKEQQVVSQFDEKLTAVDAALAAPFASKFEEYKKEKAVMQGLFDLSSDQHRQKIAGLKDNALEFVGFAKTRLSTAVDNMEKTKSDLRTQGEVNDFLNDTYMLIARGVSSANKDNVKLAKEKSVPKIDPENPEDGEDQLDKMERERTLNGINSYNDGMVAVTQSIVTQMSKIDTQKGAIEGAKKLNDDQIRQTQDLAASSVADTAIRLTTTFATLNSATAGEAAQTAEYLLNKMDADNQASIGRMFDSAARGLDKRNRDVLARIESVASLANTMNSFTSDATSKVHDLLGSMEALTEQNRLARESISNVNAVSSEVQSAREAGEEAAPAVADVRATKPANNNDQQDPFRQFGIK